MGLLIERFKNELSCWKERRLSFGGGLPCLSSCLGLLAHLHFKVPYNVLKIVEGIYNKLFGVGFERKKDHVDLLV